MKKESKAQAWSGSSRSLFERFAVNLADYTRTGKIPPEGDQDIWYSLELQNERLKKKGLTMQYSFVPRGHFTGEDKALRKWKDEHYINRLECRSCKMERKLFRDSKKEYGNQKKVRFYQTITDINGPQLAGDDVYTCPSCGAATTFAGLQKGCPYCGACFQMSDIFPVVSNYYFLEDGSFTEKEYKAYIMIIFTDELSDLPVYAGEPLGDLFEDVVDVFYTGAVGLKNFRVEGDFCFVTVNIFLDNLYDNGKRIFQKRNKYCVQVKRNIGKPVNMHFSIKHLQCKGCGASFDATKERYCPGCGKAYDLGDEDWIVTSVVKNSKLVCKKKQTPQCFWRRISL